MRAVILAEWPLAGQRGRRPGRRRRRQHCVVRRRGRDHGQIIASVRGAPDGTHGKTNPLVRVIDGYTVTIRGAMIKGIFKVGTAFIPQGNSFRDLTGDGFRCHGSDMVPKPVPPRILTQAERNVLALILSPDFGGAKELRAQLDHVRVVAVRVDGLPSVDLEVMGDVAKAPLNDGEIPVGRAIMSAKSPYGRRTVSCRPSNTPGCLRSRPPGCRTPPP